MGIDIQIRIDLTPLQKRILRMAFVSGGVLAALGVGVAVAAPHEWTTSDPLKAADLNGLNRVTTDAGIQYSVGTTLYCGTTTTTYTGSLGGYPGAKQACEGACSSKTAHMCLADEIVRSSQLNMSVGTGWYSGGIFAVGNDTTHQVLNDCDAWSGTGQYGPVWNGTGGPVLVYCGSSYPIVCCD